MSLANWKVREFLINYRDELYFTALVYRNQYIENDQGKSSTENKKSNLLYDLINIIVYITLQNSKIMGLKQLHFNEPETKTAQYTRLGVQEGIGGITPLIRPPQVEYSTMCQWLPYKEQIKFVNFII